MVIHSKPCRTCRVDLPIDSYVRRPDSLDGYSASCRSCRLQTVIRRRHRAQDFVASLNERTTCAHCGAQPIEWHNPEHVELKREHYRIGTMASRGYPREALQEELQRCTPLCRRCHMAEDGRLRAKQPPVMVSCADCGETKPHHGRQLCQPCYRHRWLVSQQARRDRVCALCDDPHPPMRKGVCNRCYQRESRRRRALTPTISTSGAV